MLSASNIAFMPALALHSEIARLVKKVMPSVVPPLAVMRLTWSPMISRAPDGITPWSSDRWSLIVLGSVNSP